MRVAGAWEPRPGIGATALTQRTQAATPMREKRSWAGRTACGSVGARGPGRSAIAARPAAPRRPAAGPTPTPCAGRSAPSGRCGASCRRRESPPRRHRPRPGPRVRVRVRVRARVRARVRVGVGVRVRVRVRIRVRVGVRVGVRVPRRRRCRQPGRRCRTAAPRGGARPRRRGGSGSPTHRAS